MEKKSKLIADVWKAIFKLAKYNQEHGAATGYDAMIKQDCRMIVGINELPDLRNVEVDDDLVRDWLDFIMLGHDERHKAMTLFESQANMLQSALPGEEWRQIAESPRYYVSNLGRVWSTHRRDGLVKPQLHRNGKRGTKMNKDKWRYRVHLIDEQTGKYYHRALSRLVAIAFIPNPNNYPEVDHIDENPQNDRADNLRWCTKEQNRMYYAMNHYFTNELFKEESWA